MDAVRPPGVSPSQPAFDDDLEPPTHSALLVTKPSDNRLKKIRLHASTLYFLLCFTARSVIAQRFAKEDSTTQPIPEDCARRSGEAQCARLDPHKEQ